MRSPKQDAVVERVVAIGGTVVGNEDEQGVTRPQPRSQLSKRAAQLGPGGGPQAVAGEGRVFEVHEMAKQVAHGRAFEQPGSLGLGPAHGQIGRRVAAIAGQDGDMIARHPSALEQAGELAQMRKVRGEVVLAIAAPVDHEHMQAFRGRRLGRTRRHGREQKRRKEKKSHHDGFALPRRQSRSQPRAARGHFGVAHGDAQGFA